MNQDMLPSMHQCPLELFLKTIVNIRLHRSVAKDEQIGYGNKIGTMVLIDRLVRALRELFEKHFQKQN
jgi:hypothetical protein